MRLALHTTSPQAIQRAADLFCDRVQDAAFPDDDDEPTQAELLEDVKHDMRVAWNEALATLGGLNPKKLPIVPDGRGQIVLLSLPEVLSLCGETNHLYVLLADVLRGAHADVLHIHLRSTYVEGWAQALLEAGWQA